MLSCFIKYFNVLIKSEGGKFELFPPYTHTLLLPCFSLARDMTNGGEVDETQRVASDWSAKAKVALTTQSNLQLVARQRPASKRRQSLSRVNCRRKMPDTDGRGPLITPNLDRRALVRVILQALEENGYSRAAEALQEESGIQFESVPVQRFREAILEGDYDDALDLLPELGPDASKAVLSKVRFEIERERYLELLDGKKIKEALICLRNSITPNAADAGQVQILAGLITFYNNPERIRERVGWIGTGRRAREQLLYKIQVALPPTLMVAPHRLDTLINQAMQQQIRACPAHFDRGTINGILQDHLCTNEAFIFNSTNQLLGHNNEVWYAAVSHDGNYLATASKDHSVCIWSLPNGNLIRSLKDHAAGVMHLAWSPNDKMILTCSLDSRARLWDLETGNCSRIFLLNSETIAGVWTEDGQAVIIASQDGNLTRFSRDGMSSLVRRLRCRDLINIDQGLIVALDCEKTVHIIKPNELATLESFNCECPSASSIRTDRTLKVLLLSELSTSTIGLWRRTNRTGTFDCEGTCEGHVNRRFVSRPSFAREDDGLIVAGSEGIFNELT